MSGIAYSELDFGDSLGIGRQGTVFKGQWKTKGLAVAIKRVLGNITEQEVSYCVPKYLSLFYSWKLNPAGKNSAQTESPQCDNVLWGMY